MMFRLSLKLMSIVQKSLILKNGLQRKRDSQLIIRRWGHGCVIMATSIDITELENHVCLKNFG